jgi:hypothetical protein
MNSFQSTISSPRNQRIMFWVGLAVLAGGIVFLIVKLAGGSDSTSVNPAPTFKPALPAKTIDLKTSSGAKVTSYEELPTGAREAIASFVGDGVLNGDYGASWKYTAPSITHGVTQQKWASLDARSVIPLPGYTLDGVTYRLEEATTKEILVVLRMQPSKPEIGRPTPMRIGLIPRGTGANQRWLVNYWMPATSNVALPYGGTGG